MTNQTEKQKLRNLLDDLFETYTFNEALKIVKLDKMEKEGDIALAVWIRDYNKLSDKVSKEIYDSSD